MREEELGRVVGAKRERARERESDETNEADKRSEHDEVDETRRSEPKQRC